MKLSDLFSQEGISLEDTLNFVTDGVVIVNSGFEILFFSSSAKEICGIAPEGHYSNWPEDVGVYNLDKKTFLDPEKLPLVRAVQGETVIDQHLYLKNEFLNDWKCVSCNASPMKKDGKIVGAILSFRDITSLLRREEEIKKDKGMYHKILNSLPAYVFAKDLNGKYTFLNEKFLQDFEDTFGTKVTGVVTKQMQSEVFSRDHSVILSKKVQEFEEEYPNALTGEKIYFHTTRIPLIDAQNNVYGLCGIAYDITEERNRKKLFEDERLKIATASKLAALGMLAAELGHEINNPLAIIRTSSWILRKILSTENVQREMAMTKLDEIDATIQRMTEIVTSLKNISRDSSSEKKCDYLLKDILRDVQSICFPRFHPKGIKFKLELDPTLTEKHIHCFRVQLSEVLINLIVNAADAAETSEDPWIQLNVFVSGETLYIRITDSGPGVPEGLEKKIFIPFFSTKELGKGTGLGLSISKDIMKRHGGDLNLNRTVSDSCFEASLPLN